MLEFISKYKDVGSAIVVVIGAAWALFVYFFPPKSDKPPVVNTPAVQRVDDPPKRPMPLAMEQAPTSRPKISVVGRNSWSNYPKGQRAIYVFACVFILFWCLAIVVGIGSAIGQISSFSAGSLVIGVPFLLVPLYMIYMGLSIFVSQIAETTATVRAIATMDLLIITTEIKNIYSQSVIATSDEWSFSDGHFVSRKDGTSAQLPKMPPYVREMVSSFLGEHWI